MTNNTIGSSNSAFGQKTLYSNISGSNNVAVGHESLTANISGSDNIATGKSTLTSNTIGNGNVAIGNNCAQQIISGSNNVALGYNAGPSSDLSNSISIGYNASVAASNTIQLGDTNITNVKTSGTLTLGTITYPKTGGTSGQVLTSTGTSGTLSWTTVGGSGTYVPYSGATGAVNLGAYDLTVNSLTVGKGAGSNNGENSAFGISALTSNTTGFYNTAIGYNTLKNNTFGLVNTAIGAIALRNNIDGNQNAAIGGNALSDNISGSNNAALGYNALFSNTTGNNNIAIGLNALFSNTTGFGNTAIGYNAGPATGSTGLSNTCAIGNDAQVTASNTIQLGNSSITSLQCQVSLTSPSDVRLKTNFQELDASLDFISKLKPLRFDWKLQEGQTDVRKDIGFTAQDLLEVQDTTGINIPNLVNTNDPEKYGVCYTQLIPILVKAIQDLKKEVDELKNAKNQ